MLTHEAVPVLDIGAANLAWLTVQKMSLHFCDLFVAETALVVSQKNFVTQARLFAHCCYHVASLGR